MRILYKAVLVASFLTFTSCQSTRQNNIENRGRSRTTAASDVGQGRTLGLIRPLIGGLVRGRPLPLGSLGSGALQSDPLYDGGYPSYGGIYGGYGGIPIYGGYPGIFGGYGPYAYRPPPYYPLYGGYNPYAGYQRPSYGSYGGGLNGLRPSSSSGGIASTLGSGAGAASTTSQAQLANQLGQALGASLRPLLAAGGGASGVSGAGGAGGLASLLGLLG
ncbi:shematrin-like protein 2 [Anastrepha obliqua]|uniref:shematrin-like protein 2 n=1 Tax=Anastrepha obliqua TaxID=95512 RepID=UPI00240A12AF|nr:shematrin-like protein 2 [Anastrepha obliqua]